MKPADLEAQSKIKELLIVLDGDIEHIRKSLSLLNELRSLVVKRDDESLSKLLESISGQAQDYENHQAKRLSIRKDLAQALGCRTREVTLSALEGVVPEENKAGITGRKEQLRSLTEQLKKEHLSTTMLLSDCAKFNHMLLENVFKLSRDQTVTYDSAGIAEHQNKMAFMNLQF